MQLRLGGADIGPLAEHLLDPADTEDDVKRAADALVKLATAEEVPELTQFFGTYRATAPNEEMEQAVLVPEVDQGGRKEYLRR